MTRCKRWIVYSIWVFVLTNSVTPALAQDVSVPDPGLNAAIRQAMQKPTGPLTAQDLLQLTSLEAAGRNIANLAGLEAARNLNSLDLFNNRLTNFSLPSGLTNLIFLDVSANALTNCSLPVGLAQLENLVIESTSLTNLTLPAGMTGLIELDLVGNRLARLAVPADMTNLIALQLPFNQLTNLDLPANLTRLGTLDVSFNSLRSLALPPGLTRLASFFGGGNQLTNVTLPADMTNLTSVEISDNQLRNLTAPPTLTRLKFLRLNGNELGTFTLPPGLTNLTAVFLQTNRLTSLVLPAGLTHLVQVDVRGNSLTNLTLPPDMTQFTTLVVDGNPLATLVLSEPLSTGNLAFTVQTLRNQGVSVFDYPLSIHLTLAREQPIGAFRFAINGPPGVYTVFESTNLVTWSPIGPAANPLGSVFFAVQTNLTSHRFYRALLQGPPSNMVFIAANTFTMGSPTNDADRSIFEGPQSTVTLTRGFWIGKYEVTQGEYLSIMNINPSDFPGDLSRPVSSVTWLDATNYCARLTQRELAMGRIPLGSQYRLPTEAEWECAARAGTSTRFSYGEDPGYASLANYAWFLDFAILDLTVHSVGQKVPNPWGLYDMYGNVWEWCQDWYGDQTGGNQTDPTGPASSPNGTRVMRGGAYDYPNSSCRSASRLFRFPSWPDTDLGFRVVLVTEP